jgi:hypothetical protein
MLLTFEAENFGRWRNVESVPVSVVGRAQLRTVRLRAAEARHDQVCLMNESVLGEVGFHFGVAFAERLGDMLPIEPLDPDNHIEMAVAT